MVYTYQELSESGSFAHPDPDAVRVARSHAELELALTRWEDAHARVGSDLADACLWVWVGRVPRELRMLPDMIATRGPRGGFRLRRDV